LTTPLILVTPATRINQHNPPSPPTQPRPDYLKCPHPLAWTLSNIVLSALEFREGYQAAGAWGPMLNNVGAMTAWLEKAHISASDKPEDNVFVGQVGLLCVSGAAVHGLSGRLLAGRG